MSLSKLFNRIFFHNNTTPALDEDNLNAMSKAINDIDDRVINLAGTIMEDVPQIQEDIEELEEDFELIDGKITEAQAAAASAQNSANAAAGSVTSAQQKALIAEGWAKGTQNGSPVSQSSPYWQNNAEYFKDQAKNFTPTGYQDLVDDVEDVKQTLSDEVSARSQLGAHNLWDITHGDKHGEGITINNTGDGTVTLRAGTVSSNEWFFPTVETAAFYAEDLEPNTTYVASIGQNGITDFRLEIYVKETSASSWANVKASNRGAASVDFTTLSSFYCYWIRIQALKNTVLGSDFTIKPMVTLAIDSSTDFTPYAMTNQQLTEKVSEEDGTFTASQGTLNTGRTYVHRFGKMVVCSFHINAVTLSISSTFVQIATLSIKPKMDTVVPIQASSNNTPFSGLLDTNGNLYCIPREVVNSDRLTGNFSYYVN